MSEKHHIKRKSYSQPQSVGKIVANGNPATREKKYTPKELADKTGCSLNSVYNYIGNTETPLRCEFVNGQYQITLAQFRDFNAARTAAKLAKKLKKRGSK